MQRGVHPADAVSRLSHLSGLPGELRHGACAAVLPRKQKADDLDADADRRAEAHGHMARTAVLVDTEVPVDPAVHAVVQVADALPPKTEQENRTATVSPNSFVEGDTGGLPAPSALRAFTPAGALCSAPLTGKREPRRDVPVRAAEAGVAEHVRQAGDRAEVQGADAQPLVKARSLCRQIPAIAGAGR